LKWLVTVAHCHVLPGESPWVEHEGKRLVLHPLDAIKNARRKRPARGGPVAPKPTRPTDFDPPRALLRTSRDKDVPGQGGGS
jgi:putative transposase